MLLSECYYACCRFVPSLQPFTLGRKVPVPWCPSNLLTPTSDSNDMDLRRHRLRILSYVLWSVAAFACDRFCGTGTLVSVPPGLVFVFLRVLCGKAVFPITRDSATHCRCTFSQTPTPHRAFVEIKDQSAIRQDSQKAVEVLFSCFLGAESHLFTVASQDVPVLPNFNGINMRCKIPILIG